MKSFWDELPRPFFALAPMEAVTDVVFRHVVAAAAPPDVWFTEFTNATGWVHAGQKAIGGRLVKTDNEQPIIAQIWGGEPGDMEQLARHCAELGYDGIDINMGCPAKSAIKSGGSALIRQPELAARAIASAKTSGLPVSVKTRLGYTHIDEWREWLAHLLRQDIVNLTIHLRTKKEMSKVAAHHELIPEIKKLRDEIAPHTLLTINGDIRDRQHGLELVEQYGVDGIMIGRGIFHNPFAFAFAHSTPLPSLQIAEQSARRSLDTGAANKSAPSFATQASTKAGAAPLAATRADDISNEQGNSGKDNKRVVRESERQERIANDSSPLLNRSDRTRDPAPLRADFASKISDDASGVDKNIQKRLLLLHIHLNLYDQYHDQTGRPYETLKRFYKIYIRDFAGASELRDQLMHTSSTDDVRLLLAKHFTN